MTVLFLSPNDDRWKDQIAGSMHATIFHHPAWIYLITSCYNMNAFIFCVETGSGVIKAGIPIVEVARPFSNRRWVALPFSDYCNPICLDEESECEVYENVIEEAKRRHLKQIELRCRADPPLYAQECKAHLLHTVRLEPDITNVARRVHRQQMQNVRAAIKNDISIRRGNGLDETKEFYRLHTLTRRRHGVPVQPWQFFKNMNTSLLEKGLGFILLAYQRQKCVSAGLFLHWNKTLTYKYSATDDTSFSMKPNHLLTWTAMEWGCDQGYTSFDFGRTNINDEGLRTFKNRWGAEEHPLIYSYIPSIPSYLITKIGTSGGLVKTLIRKSPEWLTRFLGEISYRYFS